MKHLYGVVLILVIVHPKVRVLSSFAYAVPNTKVGSLKNVSVQRKSVGYSVDLYFIDLYFIIWQKNKVKISSFVFHKRKKIIQILTMKVSKP